MKLIRAALILLHVVSTYGHGQGQEGAEDVIKIDDDGGDRVLGKAGGKAPKVKKDECQRRVDKLEARLMKLEAALAGGEEEEAEEEEEEEDRGGSGRGGIFGDGEGMSPRTHCGCDPKVCTMDVLNREIVGSKLIGRITWLLSDPQAALQGKQLDSPIDACIQVCEIDYPGQCDECNPLRSKPANVPYEVLRRPSTCDRFDPSSYDPRDERRNYQDWLRCKGCIYVQDGTISQKDIVTFSSTPGRELITQLAHSMGADIISPKLLPKLVVGVDTPLNYEYQLSNLWQGDFIEADNSERAEPFGTYAESNRLFDYRNIKCCVETPTKLGDFECQPDDEDFALFIRDYYTKNSNALWLPDEQRERLMSSIGVGISLCASTFVKATTDKILVDIANQINKDVKRNNFWSLVTEMATFALGFVAPEGAFVGEIIELDWEETLTKAYGEKIVKGLKAGFRNIFGHDPVKLTQWYNNVLKESGNVVGKGLVPFMAASIDYVNTYKAQNNEPEVIETDVHITDQIMDYVYQTGRSLSSQLPNMTNPALFTYLGYLMGEDQACSLKNVQTYVDYMIDYMKEPTCAIMDWVHPKGNTPTITETKSVSLKFNGFCKKNDHYYIAKWDIAYSWSTYNPYNFVRQCSSNGPDLSNSVNLGRLDPKSNINHFYLSLMKLKFVDDTPSTCRKTNWDGVECWYSDRMTHTEAFGPPSFVFDQYGINYFRKPFKANTKWNCNQKSGGWWEGNKGE